VSFHPLESFQHPLQADFLLLKVMSKKKGVLLKVLFIDRSPFNTSTARISSKHIPAPSCEKCSIPYDIKNVSLHCSTQSCTVLHGTCTVLPWQALFAQSCTAMHGSCAVLHRKALFCTVLHCSARVLHYSARVLHWSAHSDTIMHSPVLFSRFLHYSTLVLHCSAQFWAALHWQALFCAGPALFCTCRHCSAQSCLFCTGPACSAMAGTVQIVLHCFARVLRCSALEGTVLHSIALFCTGPALHWQAQMFVARIEKSAGHYAHLG